MTLKFEDYLASLLRPLGVYDLRPGTVNRGELAAYGARLDGAEGELDHTAREMNLTTAEDFGLERVEQLLPYLSGNFDFVVDYCRNRIPKIRTQAPDATYLMWLDCRGLGLDDDALRDFMIHQAGLGLNEGRSFGRSLSGFMRLNAACPRSVLEQAMRQLEAAVNRI